MKKSGIYKITNIENGKFYIGQSEDIRNRRNTHYAKLRANSHPNQHLQNAFNKYGEGVFYFEVLELCSIEELHNKEQLYLNKFVGSSQCYNVATDSSATFRGRLHTQESIDKMKRPKSEETKKKMSDVSNKKKPVLQLDSTSEKPLKEYTSLNEAARQTGINPAHISVVCNNKLYAKTAGGFRWKFKYE